MNLAMRQVKACADFIDTLDEIATNYEKYGLIDEARKVKEQVAVWRDHLAFWEQTLVEETKIKETFA